jgi:SAM-dependent methyltransferase
MQATLDMQRTERFAGQVLGDLGAAVSAALVYLGDRLGLYAALAEGEALTPGELAERCSIDARYAREWLANQAASGYVEYDAQAGRFRLPEEHAAVLADETSPFSMVGGFVSNAAVFQALDRLEQAYRDGAGVAYQEHDARLFHGIERFFGPTYRNCLVQSWLPALEGVVAALEAGATVADVGCGHGRSILLMAEAFPRARFVGFDDHAGSIDTARRRAEAAGLNGRARFERAAAHELPEAAFDVVAFFDALHDMGDPVRAASCARRALRPGGTLMVVEPRAGDRLEDNLHPVGRAYYGFSALVCCPASLSQPGRCGLGAQAGEARLREVLARAGFRTIRLAAETPFNMVLEAKP